MTLNTEETRLPQRTRATLWRRFIAWARRVELERRLSVLLLLAAIITGGATFAAMTGSLPGASDPRSILLLLVLDMVLLLCFATLIARRIVRLWLERRREIAGARLHARLVGLFALVAVLPSLVIAIFSVLLFDFGLQGWFSDRVRTAVKESLFVAEAYLQEHRQTINADALAMANDLNRSSSLLIINPQQFAQMVNNQAAVRSLTEAIVFQRSGRVLARAGFSTLFEPEPTVPDWALDRAEDGSVIILTAETEDRVRALLKLEYVIDTYLLVGRMVDPRVLGHIERTSTAVQLYEQLEGERTGLIVTFAVIFLIVALLLLMAAAWVGLAFADRLSRPIGRLITAADRVGAGDLSARVLVADDEGEVGSLARAFNRMTSDLQRQQGALIEANRQIEDRRRFIETVLSGVTAGVIGLDLDHRVTLTNRSACELLAVNEEQLRGRRLSNLSRDLRQLLEMAERRPGRVHERQITLSRPRGFQRTLLLRVVAESDDEGIMGYVVTFDDVTELLSAQRKAAWADVARRIAHEIKNPLTPIQLSAERLKRKYLKEINTDREVFEACIDTIVRQVKDMRRMVDEFSSFARMPTPVAKRQDLRRLITEATTLQQSGAIEGIEVRSLLPAQPVELSVDAGQLRQALTNLVKNAAESVEARQREQQEAGEAPLPGEVIVSLLPEDEQVVIQIDDNGKGLPTSQRERLTEPYITTRERGTGLGLAIVKKIMEDHRGDLVLDDRPGGGARVRLVFPLRAEGVEQGDDGQHEEKGVRHGS